MIGEAGAQEMRSNAMAATPLWENRRADASFTADSRLVERLLAQ